MDIEKLREAVKILGNNETSIRIKNRFADDEYCGEFFHILLSACQELIDVAGVMPKKEKVSGYDHVEDCYYCGGCFQEGKNSGIDDCTLSVASGWFKKSEFPEQSHTIGIESNPSLPLPPSTKG